MGVTERLLSGKNRWSIIDTNNATIKKTVTETLETSYLTTKFVVDISLVNNDLQVLRQDN